MTEIERKYQQKLAGVYRFLRQALEYPIADWLNREFQGHLTGMLTELGEVSESRALDDFFSEPGWLETLQAEHTRLFVSSAPHVAVPPRAGIFLPGVQISRLREIYARHAYAPKSDEPEDHLVIMLDFQSALLAAGEEEEERRFATAFVCPWLGKAQDRLQAAKGHLFYQTILAMIAFFACDAASE